MIIKFNPSTQVYKGFLGGRFDVYPDPTSKTYPLQHVLKPDSAPPLRLFNLDGTAKEPDYSNWLASVAKHYEVNPMLCAFFTLPENVTLETAKTYLSQVFTKNRLATLDSMLVLPNSIHYVSPYMRNRCKFGTPVKTRDFADLIASVNQKLSTLAIDIIGGTAEPIEPQTVDVGDAATDRASIVWIQANTWVTKGNPANANGSLDTVDIWLNANTASNPIRAGIFYLDTGTTYICRDAESLGNVSAGSKQTITGLAISVQTDDFIGADVAPGGTGSANVEADSSGGSGAMAAGGQLCDALDSASFTTYAGYALSLYGTGVETGGGIVRQMMEYHGG